MPPPARSGRWPRRLFSALLLGVGTLFQPKARPDEHWSTSPKVQAEVDDAAESSGAPPGSDPAIGT